MAVWMNWMALAAALVILEMFSGTFYLLVLGIALAAGGLVALLGLDLPWQFLVAALVGASGVFLLRRMRPGAGRRVEARRNRNINLDIGNTLTVDHWEINDSVNRARVRYRGALWDVELAPGCAPEPGEFIIHEVKGNRLIVVNHR